MHGNYKDIFLTIIHFLNLPPTASSEGKHWLHKLFPAGTQVQFTKMPRVFRT